MKLKDFYSSKIDNSYLIHLEEDYMNNMNELLRELNQGEWSQAQKKRQKSSILPNIALYKTFQQYYISKEEAKELVRERAFYRAEQGHKILRFLFFIPKFSHVFRFIMRKGMAGTEIWRSEVIADDKTKYEVDVLKCLWADTCEYFDCPEICELFCLCDHIVFGNIDKMEFQRSETLGMNGKKCDFCFRFKNADGK